MRTNEMNEKSKQKIKGHTTESSIAPAVLSYRASWVDNLINWIKRLPIPSWLFYVGLFSVLTIAIQIAYWIDGNNPFDVSEGPLVFHITAIYPVMVLAAIHYIDNTARRSFDDFQPALGKSETETARLRYELTTIPSRQAGVLTVIGGVFGLCLVFLADYGWFADSTPFAFGIVIAITILGFALTAVMLYHTVRQLQLVSYIHSIATEINLLQFAPLYAFSRLSAHTGLFFILVLYFDLVFNSETLKNPGLMVINGLVLPLAAVACFILPIEGMHRRLVLEKRHLQWEVNQRLEASMNQLYQQVDATDLRNADAMNKTITSLITTRELITKIPTWPWQPETSALFFSALTFPIIAFLIQLLLKNLFGL